MVKIGTFVNKDDKRKMSEQILKPPVWNFQINLLSSEMILKQIYQTYFVRWSKKTIAKVYKPLILFKPESIKYRT